MARIQRVYQDAQSGGSSEVLELITQRMEEEMTKYAVVIFKNKYYILEILLNEKYLLYDIFL